MKIITGAILLLASAVLATGLVAWVEGNPVTGVLFAPPFFVAGIAYMVAGSIDERRARRGR